MAGLHPTETTIIDQGNRPWGSGVFAFWMLGRGTIETHRRMRPNQNFPSFRPWDCSTRPLTRKKLDTRQLEGRESRDIPRTAQLRRTGQVLTTGS